MSSPECCWLEYTWNTWLHLEIQTAYAIVLNSQTPFSGMAALNSDCSCLVSRDSQGYFLARSSTERHWRRNKCLSISFIFTETFLKGRTEITLLQPALTLMHRKPNFIVFYSQWVWGSRAHLPFSSNSFRCWKILLLPSVFCFLV